MGHLTIESLARLVSEAPSPEEQEHLDSCPTCQAELAALEAQTEAVGALPDLRPPPVLARAVLVILMTFVLRRLAGRFQRLLRASLTDARTALGGCTDTRI